MREKESRPVFLKRFLILSPVLAGILAIFLLLVPVAKRSPGLSRMVKSPDVTRIKGDQGEIKTDPMLFIYRKLAGDIELLKAANRVEKGDLLQIAYRVKEDTHGVIVSLDGRGAVTLHFPQEIGGDTLLTQNKRILLDSAYELDDAPEFERFFFVTAKSRLNVSTILEEMKHFSTRPDLAKNGELALPAQCKQYSIILLK